MLSGIRGKAAWGNKNQQSWLHEPRGSTAPSRGEVRQIIERVSPGAAAGAVRADHRRWLDGWGNEIETTDFETQPVSLITPGRETLDV